MQFPLIDVSESETILWENVQCDFPALDLVKTDTWIKGIIKEENKSLLQIQFIFCDDSYLQEINLTYLKHHSLTDIITFQYSDNPIQAEIYISVDRVAENAQILSFTFQEELLRVIIHGVLHCCGYGDKSEDEKSEMRRKENIALQKLTHL